MYAFLICNEEEEDEESLKKDFDFQSIDLHYDHMCRLNNLRVFFCSPFSRIGSDSVIIGRSC